MAEAMSRRQFLSEALTNAENERIAISVRVEYLNDCLKQPMFMAMKPKDNPAIQELNAMESKLAGVSSWIDWLKKAMILAV